MKILMRAEDTGPPKRVQKLKPCATQQLPTNHPFYIW